MAWSWDDYQVLLRSTLKVCIDRNESLVEGHRFSADVYNPPHELGLPAQYFKVTPALHGTSITGVKMLMHDPGFVITLHLN